MSQVSVTINKPVERVWEIFMNPDNLKHWLTGFVSHEHVSGSENQPGSVTKMKFNERGKLMEVMETVLVHKLQEQYSFVISHDSFETKTDVQFKRVGDQTEMVQNADFKPKGFFMKLITP